MCFTMFFCTFSGFPGFLWIRKSRKRRKKVNKPLCFTMFFWVFSGFSGFSGFPGQKILGKAPAESRPLDQRPGLVGSFHEENLSRKAGKSGNMLTKPCVLQCFFALDPAFPGFFGSEKAGKKLTNHCVLLCFFVLFPDFPAFLDKKSWGRLPPSPGLWSRWPTQPRPLDQVIINIEAWTPSFSA